MKALFDAEPIKAQLANLIADRERIDRTIESLQAALRSMEGISSAQAELKIDLKGSGITLHDAVTNACLNLKDGITRQRVISEVERLYPLIKPKGASVAASLINLTKKDPPLLNVAVEGRGRSPTIYSIHNNTVHHLSSEESKELFYEINTKGNGGWQSLFASLQKNFDKQHGNILLTAEQRGRIFMYYRTYGGGGWQDRIKRIFRRELPHLFAT